MTLPRYKDPDGHTADGTGIEGCCGAWDSTEIWAGQQVLTVLQRKLEGHVREMCRLSFCLGALLFNVTYLLYHSPLLCFLPHTAFLTIPSSCVTDPLVTANFYRSRRCLTLKQNYGNSEGRWIHELCMKDLRLEFANFSRVCMNVLGGDMEQ